MMLVSSYPLNNTKNFNIFHTNINGLESKLVNLNEFLSGIPYKIDVIAVTETSEKEDTEFLSNVEMDNYIKLHTASKSSKGGTAVYVNKNLDSIERTDLNVNSPEYESTWSEIKNKRSKNIIIASIYRHPHNNSKDFFHYLENCWSIVTKENKELYICYGCLPHVLQPTRVTENTATVIDNIFSNNIQDNTISGNILLTLSKHFSRFLSVKRETVDIKKVNIYQRDYTNFSSDSFREDISIQNWKYTHDNVHDSFSDFYSKLEGSVSRHAPLKKLTPEEVKLKSKPWLNVEIQKLIKMRNKVFARKKRQPNNVNHK